MTNEQKREVLRRYWESRKRRGMRRCAATKPDILALAEVMAAQIELLPAACATAIGAAGLNQTAVRLGQGEVDGQPVGAQAEARRLLRIVVESYLEG